MAQCEIETICLIFDKMSGVFRPAGKLACDMLIGKASIEHEPKKGGQLCFTCRQDIIMRTILFMN